MSLYKELLWQHLRILQKWRPSRFWSHRDCCQSERHSGGQENEEQQHDVHSESTNTKATQSEPQLEKSSVVPLLNMWMRLSANIPVDQQRTLCRLQLQQRPMLQNLRQVVTVHWNSFCGSVFPRRLAGAEAQASTHTLIPDETESPNMLQNVLEFFSRISDTVEAVLIDPGSSSSYINTSEAMDVIDFSEISEQLNSFLVDHLVNNDEFLTMQSLSELYQ